MCSANVFLSSWRHACINLVRNNDNFFLVNIANLNLEDIWKELKSLGYRCIGPSNALNYPYICININIKTFFSGYVGYDTLGNSFVGNKAITYDEFIKINNIFNK